jgi:hypothetical protein
MQRYTQTFSSAIKNLLYTVAATRPFCFHPLNLELNPICNLLTLVGAHHILHVSRIRVNFQKCIVNIDFVSTQHCQSRRGVFSEVRKHVYSPFI